MRGEEAGGEGRWVERMVMVFGSSHDGVPAGGGRDSVRLPWRSRAGKLNMETLQVRVGRRELRSQEDYLLYLDSSKCA